VDQPLLDWQAVVVGGGVINGISLEGHWPKARIQEMLEGETVLLRRWNHALTCSLAMADDETVPTGTRYDALRMIALMDENIALDILERYLEKDTHPELQQGAVSGLGDIPSDPAKTLLRSSLPNLTESNRRLAEAALVRQ
jgi:hypothetical protein